MPGKSKNSSLSRRNFIKNSSFGLGSLGLGLWHWSCSREKPQTTEESIDKRLGVALVGLGNYATNQLAPALQLTKECYLAGIVTGTKEKEKIWQDKYGIPVANTYNYENFHELANNPDIDVVYIVLPNSMHAEYSIKGAEAGKHVICEKPMAISAQECRQMITACHQANRKLGIGYRLHYDPFNLEAMRLGQHQVLGKITEMQAGFGFTMGDLNQWRAVKALAGGGPLMDVGIYALQASIYTLGELPLSLTAQDLTMDKDSWTDVEGTLDWQMKFPSGLQVDYRTSYEENIQYLKCKTESGFFELQPSYMYNGLKGNTSEGPMTYETVNQQALQMDAFARSVLYDEPLLVPGEMGLRDMIIIEKIYQSAYNGGEEIILEDLPQILHKV